MSDAQKTTFLPNLVGGVSIWKLARDLNEEKFFDRRLLVPETEGSDSLPVSVRWKLDGLLPLREARARFPEDAQRAVEAFVACVKKVSAEFDDPKSGYTKYQKAFTVPALDAQADNYFFDPVSKKLMVINWGAAPRAIGGREEFVFGYGSFDKLFAGAAAAGTAAVVADAAATPAPVAPAAAAVETKPEEKKDEDKKKEEEKKKPGALLWGRPWWMWLLVLLAILLLLFLLLFLLRECTPPWENAPDAGVDGAALDAGADADVDAAADAAADASSAGDAGDAGKDADADGGKDDADAGDAGKDAGSDGGKDAGGDAGKDGGGKDGDASGEGPDGPGGPGGPGGVGIGGGGGKIRVVPGGPLVPVDTLPHRAHFHPDAQRWKVASGEQFLAAGSPKSGEGQHFDVVLKPGNTFEQVTVLWQDRKGVWHQ